MAAAPTNTVTFPVGAGGGGGGGGVDAHRATTASSQPAVTPASAVGAHAPSARVQQWPVRDEKVKSAWPPRCAAAWHSAGDGAAPRQTNGGVELTQVSEQPLTSFKSPKERHAAEVGEAKRAARSPANKRRRDRDIFVSPQNNPKAVLKSEALSLRAQTYPYICSAARNVTYSLE